MWWERTARDREVIWEKQQIQKENKNKTKALCIYTASYLCIYTVFIFFQQSPFFVWLLRAHQLKMSQLFWQELVTSLSLFFFFLAWELIFTAYLSAMDHVMHPYPPWSDVPMSNKKQSHSKAQSGMVRSYSSGCHDSVAIETRRTCGAQTLHLSTPEHTPALFCPKTAIWTPWERNKIVVRSVCELGGFWGVVYPHGVCG